MLSTNFRKSPNTNFHENSFSRSRIVSCGMEDMMKLTANFRNFGKTPKNDIVKKSVYSVRYEDLTVVLMKTAVVGLDVLYSVRYEVITIVLMKTAVVGLDVQYSVRYEGLTIVLMKTAVLGLDVLYSVRYEVIPIVLMKTAVLGLDVL